MRSRTLGTELTEIEARGLINLTWPALGAIYSVQALVGQPNFSDWQLWYVVGVIISGLISLVIQNYTSFTYAYLPMVSYLLIVPIYLGDLPEKSWMSYGLLGVAATIYFAYSSNVPAYLTILAMATVNILIAIVVRKPLTSFSDYQDMQLLNGYFSFIWTFGLGVATYFIRNQYLNEDSKIESKIELLKESISTRLQQMSKQNREDYRNLKLHGTVLNTLIYAKNNSGYLFERLELSKALKREISELASPTHKSILDFESSIKSMLATNVNMRVKITNLDISGYFLDVVTHDSFLEIIREILLNIEKHTTATEASIHIKIDGNGYPKVTIIDNSFQSNSHDHPTLITRASESKSLLRLLSVVPARLELSDVGTGIKYYVSLMSSSQSTPGSIEIYETRQKGLVSFAINLTKAISIIGLLFLPGYIYIGIRIEELFLLSLQAFSLSLLIFFLRKSAIFLAFTVWLSIATPVLLSQNVSTCGQVQYFPWLVNIILTATLVYSLFNEKRIQKWIPLLILTIELLLLPLGYPSECSNIFLGTLPGIPLILLFYWVLTSIRKRAFLEDARAIRSVYEDERNIEQIELSLSNEFNEVIADLSVFVEHLSEFDNEELKFQIELQIQKLRTFLICSEQFESHLIRDLYYLASRRLGEGFLTRLSLLGNNFYEIDAELDFQEDLDQLSRVLLHKDVEILVSRNNGITVEILVSREISESLTAELHASNLTRSKMNFVVREKTL